MAAEIFIIQRLAFHGLLRLQREHIAILCLIIAMFFNIVPDKSVKNCFESGRTTGILKADTLRT